MIRKSLLSCIKVAVVIVLINLPSIVFSSSCRALTPEERIAFASLVFKGTMIAFEPPIRLSTLGTRAKFKVTDTYKGSVFSEVIVGHRRDLWHATIGDKVTVFAYGNLKDGFVTDTCLMGLPSDDAQRQLAVEAYRDKRNALAEAIKKNSNDQNLYSNKPNFLLNMTIMSKQNPRLVKFSLQPRKM